MSFDPPSTVMCPNCPHPLVMHNVALDLKRYQPQIRCKCFICDCKVILDVK